MAVLAAGALLWGIGAGPADADSIRDGQWALQNYKAAENVWPISQGDGVTVAVIDSGVSDHIDLAGQVLPGADFSGEKSDGHVDKVGHGTGMASLIAGHGHGDQSGVMGLAPKAKILPVRIGISEKGEYATGQQDDLANALHFAVDHGATVINMSLGSASGNDTALREAVKYAVSKDVVLVASSGNSGNQNRPVEYPAAFPGVVVAGAVDQQGNIWDKSNRGPEVTLTAPGVGIYEATAKSADSYGRATGTSDSTAYVSAIAALIRSKYPNLSAGQVINRMIKSAVAPPDHSQVPNNSYGYGIASPSKALAPNPAVDNGPKDNPLATRAESQGDSTATSPAASQSADPGGAGASGGQAAPPGKSSSRLSPVVVIAVVGVVALLVIVGIILLVRRSRGGGPNGNGSGGPGGYAPPTAPPPYSPVGQQYPPQPQPPYGTPPQSYPPQQQAPYGAPPQQPPSSGNPYS